MAYGPAGSLAAVIAFLLWWMKEQSDHQNQRAAGVSHPDASPVFDPKNLSTAIPVVLGGALRLSFAGMVRSKSAYQHAHHLAGLLFGCAYAMYAMPPMSRPAKAATAEMKR